MSGSSTHRRPASSKDGVDVLDVCHRQIIFTLGKLSALLARLATFGHDAEAQAMAGEIVGFFSTTVRLHHEDEERHVFPQLVADGDPEVVQAVLKLQQDHDWLEEDWMQLSPQLAAVAAGQSGYDLDALREGVAGFSALLHDHIALEESCVYPQLRARLLPGQRLEMGREMAARRRHRTQPR